jgi:glycosyltransferase involved in cell wall biosynthesis
LSTEIVYVFGGEKAQGAEIVITRLIDYNAAKVNAHLMISPGAFADKLINAGKQYPILQVSNLKKLNRSSTSGYKFYLKAIQNYFAVSWRVHQYIRKNRIAVVHANTVVPASYLIPLILCYKLSFSNVRFIWSDHDLAYFSKLDSSLSKLCLRLYQRTLVVSAAVREKYNNHTKAEILYNGLDTGVFKADTAARLTFRAQHQLSVDTIILGMPAVVTPRKGQLELIEVFNHLLEIHHNIRLLFAGGYEQSTLEYSALVKEAISKNDKITHLGYIDSMTDFYNGCDIIISNSTFAGSEPLGTTIYEAMACGKLVVAANLGGTPEIITNGTDGFLFEPENYQDLKEKLLHILNTYNALDAVRVSAVHKAATRFGINSMADHYNRIIKDINRH